jgi:hypothetical protein
LPCHPARLFIVRGRQRGDEFVYLERVWSICSGRRQTEVVVSRKQDPIASEAWATVNIDFETSRILLYLKLGRASKIAVLENAMTKGDVC